jgi:hypothetical protein
MFHDRWPSPPAIGTEAPPESCPECGADLVLCEVETQNAVVRVWGWRQELLWGVSRGRFTTLRGILGPSSAGQPLGELGPVMNSQWQTARACPHCGLLWLAVDDPERLRPEQSNEVVPSETPAGRGSEVASGEG